MHISYRCIYFWSIIQTYKLSIVSRLKLSPGDDSAYTANANPILLIIARRPVDARFAQGFFVWALPQKSNLIPPGYWNQCLATMTVSLLINSLAAENTVIKALLTRRIFHSTLGWGPEVRFWSVAWSCRLVQSHTDHSSRSYPCRLDPVRRSLKYTGKQLSPHAHISLYSKLHTIHNVYTSFGCNE